MAFGETDMYRRTGLLPIALKQPDREDFSYNPPSEERVQNGTVLIVIGNPDQVAKLRHLCHVGEKTAEG
jgi:uncharacterized protein with PhoU and TrkA domain